MRRKEVILVSLTFQLAAYEKRPRLGDLEGVISPFILSAFSTSVCPTQRKPKQCRVVDVFPEKVTRVYRGREL